MRIPHPHRKGAYALIAVPILAAAPFVAAGGGQSDHARPALAEVAPAPTSATHGTGAPARAAVARAPRRHAGIVVLRASVRGARARIVAVTFLLDGHPLGSDTTAPYVLDLDETEMPRGTHALSVEAVDRLGRRITSPSVAVAGGRRGRPAVTAEPGHGFGRALAALRRGRVTVRLGPGRYALGGMRLGSDTRLIGAGAATVLTPAPGASPEALLTTAGRHVRVSDLAVDGLGRVVQGVEVTDGAQDVRLTRLRVRGVRENGVRASGAHADVSVQDSVIDGRGAANAGVFDLGSDSSRDVSVVRTRISGPRGYGVVFAQRFYGLPATALHNLALDNRIADIIDPTRQDGTDEGGIWTGGVGAAIIANHVRHTGIDGIETVGSSTRTTIVANDIAGTPVGIYLEHSTNASLIARNLITGVGTGVNVEWRHAGGGSSANSFVANRIVGARDAGMFVDVGSDSNRIEDNVFVDGARPAIVLQGASNNLVRANRACGKAGRMVNQQAGRWEDGSRATSRRNRVVGNVQVHACGP
jgi:parallel beta-helix repeat protein